MNIVIFASGRGSNAANIFQTAADFPEYLRVTALVCDRPQAGVLREAKDFSIPSIVIPLPQINDRMQARLTHERQIISALAGLKIDYLCLAGYLRILSKSFVEHYPHPEWPVSRIINIHPSLLPSFKGLDAYQQAFEHGVKISGVSTHFVSETLDDGPLIHQRHFLRYPEDSLEEFQERGLRQEHLCYRETLLALARNDYAVQQHPFRFYLSTQDER